MRVCLLAPTPFSKYSIAVCSMLLKKNIDVPLIICPSIYSLRRVITDWRREKIDLLRKIWLKIFMRNSFNAQGKTMLDAFCEENELPICKLPVFARQQRISFVTVKELNAPATADIIKKEDINLIVFTGGGLIRKTIINSVDTGILNCHWGLLPKFRGMDTAVWAEWENQPTGITLHYMDVGVDTGPVISHKPVRRDTGESFKHFKEGLEVLSLKSIVDCVVSIRDVKVSPRPQVVEDGKQYFVLHKRLEKAMVRILETQS